MSASLAGSPWWWPYVVILVAGALATQVWRWVGVLLADRLSPDGAIFQWSRLVATAIIAALGSQLVMQPQGALQIVPLWLRLIALGLGLAVLLRLKGRPFALSVALAISLAAIGAGYVIFGPV